MFRRIALGCLILTVLGGHAAYAQITQSSKVIKAKPPKKYKAPKVKRAPKPPKPATKLTPDQKAAQKAYAKAARGQRKFVVNQNKQQANQLKAQQKTVHNAVKQAKKQAKNNR